MRLKLAWHHLSELRCSFELSSETHLKKINVLRERRDLTDIEWCRGRRRVAASTSLQGANRRNSWTTGKSRSASLVDAQRNDVFLFCLFQPWYYCPNLAHLSENSQNCPACLSLDGVLISVHTSPHIGGGESTLSRFSGIEGAKTELILKFRIVTCVIRFLWLVWDD